MRKSARTTLAAGMAVTFSLTALALAGCGKSGQDASAPADTTASSNGGAGGAGGPGGGGSGGPGGGGPGGPGGGPGRPGGPGGGGAPVAANASGAEIYQAKCQGCHGPDGKGGRAPVLASIGDPAEAVFKVVHDGKGRMPAFASQLTDDQINKVVAQIKQYPK